MLLGAAAASTLPVSNSSPWTAATHAPPLARWDAVWYRSVALEGYRHDPSFPENNVGFYPLYPLILRGLAAALPVNVLWLGIAVSLACLLPALLLMSDLFAEWGGDLGSGAGAGAGAVRGVSALLLYPTSFYLASVYTESLFLLLTVLVFHSSRRGRWLLAGGAGFFASLTRLNGFLAAVPIAWYGWRACRGKSGAQRGRPLAALALTAAGALAFPLFPGRGLETRSSTSTARRSAGG